jgi:hypothetical protein
MTTESVFVETAHRLIKGKLRGQPLEVSRGAALLYQVTVDNRLRVMDAERITSPKRGESAFQTDLCIFERVDDAVLLPRVVLEFKTKVTTHDVLTYSTKAEKHKTIYPYLRYGLVLSSDKYVPKRFFTHNEGLDFCMCTGGISNTAAARAFELLLQQEIECSRTLESVAFGGHRARTYRSHVTLK